VPYQARATLQLRPNSRALFGVLSYALVSAPSYLMTLELELFLSFVTVIVALFWMLA
jgi:hypothetical protein